MIRGIAVAAFITGFLLISVWGYSEDTGAVAGTGSVTVLKINSSINPGTADYIQKGILSAEREADRLVIIELDTPGGLISSTREIVKSIMGSKVPVAVYVAPDGARAGSAGVFITLSANIAAMAPGTNIGAAHPVGAGGKDPEKDGEHMAKKIENDTVAFMESIVEKRGKNREWAVSAVKNSESITASAALEKKVIDLIATSTEDLLQKLDGRHVEMEGHTVILKTTGVRVKVRDMSLRHKITTTFSDPNIAYVLFMLGTLGLLMELYHPGVIFPGVIGGISIILAFISFQVLPINYGGLLLIIMGVVLFVAEMFVASYGILGIGGGVSLLIGSLLLVDGSDPDYFFDKEFGVSIWTIIPTLVVIAGFFVFVGYVVLRTHARKSITGEEGLVGECGTVTQTVTPGGGKVFVHGEYWFAESDVRIENGEKVDVVEVRDMTLIVKKKVR